MILKYGSYAHSNGEVQISHQKKREYSPRGYLRGLRHSVSINGMLRASSTSALTTAATSLIAAYTDGKTLAFYEPDGSTATVIYLTNSDMLGGVKVVQPPSFPTLTGAQYVTHLPYTIVLEGFEPSSTTPLLNFKESLRFIGNGGPRRVITETANTLPVEEITRQRTVYRATQSGTATAYGVRPSIPPPIWPNALDNPSHQTGEDSPVINAGSIDEITVSWSYSFSSPTPLNGRPNLS